MRTVNQWPAVECFAISKSLVRLDRSQSAVLDDEVNDVFEAFSAQGIRECERP